MMMRTQSVSRGGAGMDGRPPPPWVRVRSSSVGLVVDFLPSRRGLGQLVLGGKAMVSGELTAHLQGHGTIVLPLVAGDRAADIALELAGRLLAETPFDASVRPRGEGFSVALGVKAKA
jgi:hypothetical protein